MKNMVKKIAAGVLAFALTAGALPAYSGIDKLFDCTPIIASAETAIATYTENGETHNVYSEYSGIVDVKNLHTGDVLLAGTVVENNESSHGNELYVLDDKHIWDVNPLYHGNSTYKLDHSVRINSVGEYSNHRDIRVTLDLPSTFQSTVTEFTDARGTHKIFNGGYVSIDEIMLGDVILKGTTVVNNGLGWFMNKDTWSNIDESKAEKGAFKDLAWTHMSYTFDFDARVIYLGNHNYTPERYDVIVASDVVDINSAEVSDALDHSGEAQFPTVTLGGNALTKGTDFAVDTGDDSRTAAGSYFTTIYALDNDTKYNTTGAAGANHKYYGSKTFEWTIKSSSPDEPGFSGSSVTLSDDLGLNFIVGSATDENKDKFTVKLTGSCAENGQTLRLNKKNIGGQYYYCVTANVPAKNMNDKITAELYTEGSEGPVYIMTSSVGAYFGKVDTTGNEKLAALVEKTQQYGDVAKAYFSEGAMPGVDDHRYDILYGSFEPSINDATMSLVLKSKLSVRLYIPGLQEGDTDTSGKLTAIEGSKNRYCFEITDITPLELDKDHTIEFKGNTYTFKPMSWCYRVMTNENIAAKNIVMANALYEYYKAAKAYVDPVTVVDLSELTSNYEAQNGDVLTGKLASNVKISVANGASITLRDAAITDLTDDCDFAGITCGGGATITLEGTNAVKGGQGHPGIYIAIGKTLTIDGTGSLTATGGNNGAAGIGGSEWSSCGNIVINSGTITATGGYEGAGIGSSQSGWCDDIIITGGTVTATGINCGAGIGSGYYGYCGDITITSGVTSVTAIKGEFSTNSIGAGLYGSCDTVTIENGANVTQK